MHVLVTRAEPAASRTGQKLMALGYEPVLFPIFELVDIGGVLPEEHYDGVIFTSANAVEILANRNWPVPDAEAVAYCVGKRTAEAARNLGFARIVTASGGGASLYREIEALELPKETRLLYPTTPDRSFDMGSRLDAIGYTVDTVDVYQTRKIPFSRDDMATLVNTCRNGVFLIYSALSAAYLMELIDAVEDMDEISTISVIGISKSATNIVLKYNWRDVYVSNTPDEDAMLLMLREISST